MSPAPGDHRPRVRPSPRPGQDRALPSDPRSFTVPAPDAAAPEPHPRELRRLPPPAGPQPPAPPGTPEDVPAADGPGRRRRLRWKRVVAGVLGAIVVLVAFAGWYAYRTYQKLERVEVAAVLSPKGGGGTNYLIVGTDSREGLDADMENADVVIGDGVDGSRSDTLMILRLSDQGNMMLPIPRDLYLPIAGTEGQNRINTAIQGGPDRLIQTVQGSLGLPVHHYVEVDFAGFLELVDAIGGVEIEFDAPAFDDRSGLVIEEAGVNRLDKNQALAFVRSRYYTRVVDGRHEVDGRADLGRIERQQTFLRAVMSQSGQSRNPFTLARIGNSVAGNLRVDDSLGFFDSMRLARKLSSLDPETVELPTTPTRTSGGAAVLLLSEPGADEALARFRG